MQKGLAYIIITDWTVFSQWQGKNYTLSKRVNGNSANGESDSILTNGSSGVDKINEVTTIIQDLKSSWSSGMVADSLRPYW